MTGLPQGSPIFLCTTPVDFRKGFDGLTGIVRRHAAPEQANEQEDTR